jgi:hypothetical protein
VSGGVALRQRLQQHLGFLEIGGVKPLGKPAVDRGQQPAPFVALPLLLPQPREAHAGPEFQGLGLLNHLVPYAQLREKTMELATMIAGNRRQAVMGVKDLLLQQMGRSLEEQWALERDYTRNVVRGAKAGEAFPEFIARKGRPLPPRNP